MANTGKISAAMLPVPNWTPEYRRLATNRAIDKAQAARREDDVGGDSAHLWRAGASFLAMLPLFWLGTSSALPWSLASVSAAVSGIVGVGSLVLFVLKRPNSPVETASSWIDACSGRKFGRALSLVALGDRDDFERLAGDGRGGIALSTEDSYARYWEERLANAGLPRARMEVVRSHERPVDDRFSIVSGEMVVGGAHFNPIKMLASVVLSVAAFIGLALIVPPPMAKYVVLGCPLVVVVWVVLLLRRSNSSRRLSFQKVVVRTGNQWRIFNGEWAGPEDLDTSWLSSRESSPTPPSAPASSAV